MTPTQAKVAIAAILTTLLDMPGQWGPSGHIYMALQTADASVYTIGNYNVVLGILRDAGFVTTTSETVTLTPKGRDVAEDIERAVGRG